MARIVFDLDGTLIDSAPDIRLAANSALEGTGAAPLSVSEARGFVGSGASVFVERMMKARGLPARVHGEMLQRFVAVYEGAVHQTQPYPGAVAALEVLAARGHRLGLCTNKPIVPTRSVLIHLDLARHFETVFGGDSLPVRKPHPAPLHAALAPLGDTPAIFVGDSEVDAETADRAGVPCLIHTPGYRQAPLETLPHWAGFEAWAAVPGLIADYLEELGAGNGNRTRN